ncbi:SIR2 family protein [Pyxidicoccus parkwayensis]|uniref:SIR2 family protein n=1 Tax=Pyxidicoccus parkwayensis TaxID=2813578 RepID=A0ABX7NT32_9BACT|nr:SIR2 family protein [Pyxidicoccus parkwaysis]QSQ19298.1 SIR2 family protein [Pyxidicoccus parkwaysis]
MSTTPVDDLRLRVRDGDALFVVGSGVSVGATKGNPCASWTGLIESGINEAKKVASIGEAVVGAFQTLIRSGDLDSLLAAAEFVTRKLKAPKGGDYRSWLRNSFSGLSIEYKEVLEAISSLPGQLATTNYDGLIEEATKLPAVTWRQVGDIEHVLNKTETGVIHLHGFWRDPESVILGVRDYEKITSDRHAQLVLRSILLRSTVVFIGCGEGLADPNFGALLDWARAVFAESERTHYRLCLQRDYAALAQQHSSDRIRVVSYGENYSDLAPFLRTLLPVMPETPHAGNDRLLAYDANETPNRYVDWELYSTAQGFSERINVHSQAPDGAPQLEIFAKGTELVGANKALSVLAGRFEFEYLANYSRAKHSNLFVYAIPMQRTAGGRTLEVGADSEEDPDNAFSPYRKRLVVPSEHVGDGKWHAASIDFDFKGIPGASFSILGIRINEGCAKPGPGIISIRNVKAFDTGR